MKHYDITISFTLKEDDYKRYDKNLDSALNLILPYGEDVNIYENEWTEDE